MIKIFLVEDRALIQKSSKILIENKKEGIIIEQTCDAHQLFDILSESLPDLVLIDHSIKIIKVLELVKKIKENYPQLKILILSKKEDKSSWIELLCINAHGYILKESPGEFYGAIKQITGSENYINSQFTQNLLNEYKSSVGLVTKTTAAALAISEREMDVLHLIAKGSTNNEMAKQLFTSVRTIETRRKNLMDKTQTSNTATLIRFAFLNGLIK